MRRALLTLALLGGVVAAAMWLARMGGTVEIRVGGTFVGLPFALALLLLVLGFAALLGLLALARGLRRLPGRVQANRVQRRRAEGDAAVTRALVALAAGTPDAARSEVKRARLHLGDTPQTLLLAAEAERLAGREAAATEAFEALALRPEARFLGLRGLLRQAVARQDWPAAQRLARDAESTQPGAAWVREERARLAIRTRDWREALALATPGVPRAALAFAAAAQEPDESRAAELERQALAFDPGFVPAALAQARRLRAQGSQRRARAVIEQAWAVRPHPALGEAWLEMEPEVLLRIRAVEDLARRDLAHPEARLLMARAALEAGLTGRARQELEAAVADPRCDRRAYLMLVALEEVEYGEGGEARAAQARWLRDAAKARPEPQWRCSNCGTPQPEWSAVCPACQEVATIQWGV
jgi:HemY protein